MDTEEIIDKPILKHDYRSLVKTVAYFIFHYVNTADVESAYNYTIAKILEHDPDFNEEEFMQMFNQEWMKLGDRIVG